MLSSRNITRVKCLISALIAGTGGTGCGSLGTTSSTHDSGSDTVLPEQCGQQLTSLRRSMNGRTLQGTSMTSTTVTAATKGCVEIKSLHLEGTALVGTMDGQSLRGADFVGTTVTQVDSAGAQLAAVIAAVEVDARDASGETLLYTLKALHDGQLVELCAPDLDGKRRAIPVPGTWDGSGAHQSSATQFTFGCTSAAIGKCVRLGYRPWTTHRGVSLAGYHQACTRMIRFDYCGDGGVHTEEGTEIDVYDPLPLNTKDPSLLLTFDAAWSEAGAYCIERQRWIRLSTVDGLTLQALLPSACLSRFELAALEASPVDPLDLCSVRSKSIPRDSVKLDNRSGVNILLR